MAEYKQLHGTNIETVSSDPSNPVNGQVWYNSTDKVLKGFISNPVGAWATGGALNTGRYAISSAKLGTQTASLGFGGTTAAPAKTGEAESYNGSSWTEVADLNTARDVLAGLGTQTAAIAAGGTVSPGNTANTESWDGSSWTEVSNLNTARIQLVGTGT